MNAALAAPLITLVAVYAMMLVEARLSTHNERVLRARGAVEPAGDVYHRMRWAYPLCFVLIAGEGMLRGVSSRAILAAGLVIFGVAKALKLWAIASLGIRWSFRVLALSGEPLVHSGPYRYIRHPNYVAVCAEIIGVAVMLGAPISGALALVGFGWLMVKRIRIEERALGMTRTANDDTR